MNDRMVMLANDEVAYKYRSKERGYGGYLPSHECRCKRGCALCTDAHKIRQEKMTPAEIKFTQVQSRELMRGDVDTIKPIICPYPMCLYPELDAFETYADYDAQADMPVKTIEFESTEKLPRAIRVVLSAMNRRKPRG